MFHVQEVMNFKGSSENFLIWFNESTKNFCELTSNLSEDQRRNLTSDPGKLNGKLNPLFTEN